jgi:uncharacterized protein YdbL (DUF1318 family)
MNKKSIACLVFLTLSVILSPLATTQAFDLKEMTPEVKSAIASRQARYAELQSLKAGGIVGENNQGFVQVLRPSTDAERIAREENEDRQTVYDAIAKQNGLGPEGLGKVQEVFGEVQRGKAKPGEWIQFRNSEWVKKE